MSVVQFNCGYFVPFFGYIKDEWCHPLYTARILYRSLEKSMIATLFVSCSKLLGYDSGNMNTFPLYLYSACVFGPLFL